MHNVAETTQPATTEYGGWCNRETWVVSLWLTGDERYYEGLRDIIDNFDTLIEQEEELKRYVRAIVEAAECGDIASDLLATSLARIDWAEIVAGNQ